MIIEKSFEQGSPEWFQARAGVATASCFDKIITPTGRKSTQAIKYARRLAAEGLVGAIEQGFTSPAMERGTELEPLAREFYEAENFVEIEQVSLIYKNDQKLISCSPDGILKGQPKGLEIKCPNLETHVEYLCDGVIPNTYIPQVQGSMWVTGFEEWDFMSFHPDLPPLIVTVKKDPDFHNALETYMKEFLREKAKIEIQLKSILENKA